MRRGAQGRIGAALAAALLAGSLGFFAFRAATGEDVPFVVPGSDAPWIMPDTPVGAGLQQWGRPDPPEIVYRTSFAAEPAAGGAALSVRALGRFELRLNGEALARGDGSDWRRPARVDVSGALRAGVNQLEVSVWNKHGPGLLSLRSEGLDPPLRTGPGWTVRQVQVWEAVPADDTRINPTVYAVETPWEMLVERRDAVIGLFTLGVVAFLLARERLPERARARLPVAALGAACLAWLWLFATRLLEMPVDLGFDARHHLQYVHLLRERGAVPLPTDGWSVYHPPLFYAGAAALERVAELFDGAAARAAALKLVPFAAGLALVFASDALCRRLFPGDGAKRCTAVLFAAVLPATLYSAAYFSNETLTALLIALALLATLDALLAPRAGLGRVALLAVLLGVGALTKFTALLFGAVAVPVLLAKIAFVERAGARRVAAAAALSALVPLLLAGWFYLRNLVLYGDPFVANWGHLPGLRQAWWQQPGFHTPAYYTRFGDALVHPYLSGFRSFWDSYYGTLWGDGGIAGRVAAGQRHGFWNYGFMSLSYLVALPATALLLLGAVLFARRALADPEPRRRAAFGVPLAFAYALLFGLAYLSLRLPYFAQAKASYALAVAPIFAVFFAAGFDRCDTWLARLPWLRAALYGWLALFTGCLYLSFAG